MKRRLLFLEKIIPHVDFFMVSHPKIKKKLKEIYGIKSIQLLPILPKIKKNISTLNEIKISGKINKYRFDKISKVKNKIYKFDKLIDSKIKTKNDAFFLDIKSRKKFKFSLHLKKNDKWQHDSPFRYFYSILKNEIPIVPNNFLKKNY